MNDRIQTNLIKSFGNILTKLVEQQNIILVLPYTRSK
jgi:hypothetical protein